MDNDKSAMPGEDSTIKFKALTPRSCLLPRRCWTEINLPALRENCRTLHDIIPNGCRLMNILKADAYGHGAVQCARVLEPEFPEDWIGTATLEEALELREAGIRQEILILGYTPHEAARILAENDITQTVISKEHAAALSRSAVMNGVIVKCHVKIDTGMSRIGYSCGIGGAALPCLPSSSECTGKAITKPLGSASLSDIAEAYRSEGLNVTGIFTHFSSSYGREQEDADYTAAQFRRFTDVCRALESAGIDPGLRHCCNSPSTVNSPEYAMDMCRVGTVLYGLLPETVMTRRVSFTPVMTWKARVAMLRDVPCGTAISYSRQARAERGMTLAVITAGDADGYMRQLTNIGRVRIRGHECRVVGRVCMDMFMADVTDLNDVSAGDEVLLLGRGAGGDDDHIPCDWLYGPLGLGPSAVTCNIRPRVKRFFITDSVRKQ